MTEEYCDCVRPNDVGRNNPCFDCAKPIEQCDSFDYDLNHCIKKRGHDGDHLAEITWYNKDANET